MPPGRPVAWDVGTAPPGIGMRAEKHDADGRFLGDRKACEEWTDYLKNHKSTERKFDNGMTKIVREGVTDFIKKTRARTDVAVQLGELDEASAQAKKMIASNKEAIEFYNSKNDKDAQGANRLPEQPTLEDIATYLTGVVDLDATDDVQRAEELHASRVFGRRGGESRQRPQALGWRLQKPEPRRDPGKGRHQLPGREDA